MKKFLVVASALCLLAVLVASARAEKQADTVSRQSVLLFPFSADTGGKSEQIVERCTDLGESVGVHLEATGRFTVVTYSPHISSVQRAAQEQELPSEQLLLGFDTSAAGIAKACRIASEMGADLALVGSIDSYECKTAGKEVQIMATADLVDCNSGKIVASAS
ncbi:MAG: hypothetical protein ACYC08_08835, partial [Armatimonadota bacterium]